MAKDTVKKPGNIDELIYKIKKGESGPEIKLTQKQQDERNDGPARHTYPRKKETEKLIDYQNLEMPKLRPNMVKLGIDEGEDRFPPEAKVPNYKKYDANGNYIKHKLPTKKENKGMAGKSAISIARDMSLSNPMTKRGRKTVA